MGISPANHGMLALCYSCKLLRYFLIILIILIYYVVATFKGFICSFRMKTVANSILHWMELPKSSSNASVALVEAAITQTLIWKRWVSMTSIILLLQQPHSGIFLRPLHQKITQGPPVKKTEKNISEFQSGAIRNAQWEIFRIHPPSLGWNSLYHRLKLPRQDYPI